MAAIIGDAQAGRQRINDTCTHGQRVRVSPTQVRRKVAYLDQAVRAMLAAFTDTVVIVDPGAVPACRRLIDSVLPDRRLDSDLTRHQQVTWALWLVSVSVAFGLAAGTVSVITGLHGHSLGVFAVGLGVLADVTGSATLIWRFRAERHRPGRSAAREWRAALALNRALGWWWADRVAALVVAAVAAVEAWHTAPHDRPPG
jgi:hypothetical protein